MFFSACQDPGGPRRIGSLRHPGLRGAIRLGLVATSTTATPRGPIGHDTLSNRCLDVSEIAATVWP